LQIDSVQVSREHAQIYQRGNIWAIRDLGSTNGTQVNGKPVRESFLSDGDILAIAETEVTFIASTVTPIQRMATQPMQPRESRKPPAMLTSELAAMRALTEATLWQVIPVELATIVSLLTDESEAVFAQLQDPPKQCDAENHSHSLHAVGRHYFELARRRAVELAQADGAAKRLFVTADIAEFQSAGTLLGNLEQLKDRVVPDCELGVTVTLPDHLDAIVLDDVSRAVRDAGLLLGVVSFQGSSGQVMELASRAPDYLLLSESMLKGVAPASQPLRRLESVLATCRQLGIKAVLPHCDCEKTMAHCRQLGYEFAVRTSKSHDDVADREAVALAG
jgi:EAL domain-containing protein (putative c-di-GMP-specific phosphodiesterase class I)